MLNLFTLSPSAHNLHKDKISKAGNSLLHVAPDSKERVALASILSSYISHVNSAHGTLDCGRLHLLLNAVHKCRQSSCDSGLSEELLSESSSAFADAICHILTHPELTPAYSGTQTIHLWDAIYRYKTCTSLTDLDIKGRLLLALNDNITKHTVFDINTNDNYLLGPMDVKDYFASPDSSEALFKMIVKMISCVEFGAFTKTTSCLFKALKQYEGKNADITERLRFCIFRLYNFLSCLRVSCSNQSFVNDAFTQACSDMTSAGLDTTQLYLSQPIHVQHLVIGQHIDFLRPHPVKARALLDAIFNLINASYEHILTLDIDKNDVFTSLKGHVQQLAFLKTFVPTVDVKKGLSERIDILVAKISRFDLSQLAETSTKNEQSEGIFTIDKKAYVQYHKAAREQWSDYLDDHASFVGMVHVRKLLTDGNKLFDLIINSLDDSVDLAAMRVSEFQALETTIRLSTELKSSKKSNTKSNKKPKSLHKCVAEQRKHVDKLVLDFDSASSAQHIADRLDTIRHSLSQYQRDIENCRDARVSKAKAPHFDAPKITKIIRNLPDIKTFETQLASIFNNSSIGLVATLTEHCIFEQRKETLEAKIKGSLSDNLVSTVSERDCDTLSSAITELSVLLEGLSERLPALREEINARNSIVAPVKPEPELTENLLDDVPVDDSEEGWIYVGKNRL